MLNLVVNRMVLVLTLYHYSPRRYIRFCTTMSPGVYPPLKGESNLFKNGAQVVNGEDSDLSTSPMLCPVTICTDVWNIIVPYCAFILFELWL